MAMSIIDITDVLNDAIQALEQIANSLTAPDADLRAIAKKALIKIGHGNLVKTTGPWAEIPKP
jgi:hypothetical protein